MKMMGEGVKEENLQENGEEEGTGVKSEEEKCTSPLDLPLFVIFTDHP